MQVGLTGPSVWVRVTGRGSFQNSAGLKDFAEEMIKKGKREFFVDLQQCELMDSTFLGVLAGIALKLRPDGRLTAVRANERNLGVLQNLGLDKIFHVSEAHTAPPAPPLDNAEANPPQAAGRDTIIQAHENLVAANPENAVRFKDVIEFLQQKETP